MYTVCIIRLIHTNHYTQILMNAYHPHVNTAASIHQAVLHAIAENGINLIVMEVVALVCI